MPTSSVIVIRRAARYIIASHFVPVHIKHHAIIHLIIEGQDVLIGKRRIELEGITEVVSRPFVARTWV